MPTVEHIKIGDTVYDLPTGGGGGQSYTAGDNITIENNVISAQVPEQRVKVDDEADNSLHSGFKVRTPHWYIETGAEQTTSLSSWNWIFRENIPVEGASVGDQNGYLEDGLMRFRFVTLTQGGSSSWTANGDGTYTKNITFYADDVLYVDGTQVTDGTASAHDVTIGVGSVLDVASITLLRLRSTGLTKDDFTRSESSVAITYYQWNPTSKAYVVHEGVESELADSSSIGSLISAGVGHMLAGKTLGNYFLGKFTDIKTLLFPEDDITASVSKNAGKLTVRNGLANSQKNLTVGFDTTYQEQGTVTYYSYQYGPEPMDFFGDGVYGGSWYGNTGSCMGKLGNEYYLDMEISQLADNLTYSKNLMVYTDGQSSQMELFLTIDNGALKVMTANGETGYDWNSNYIDLKTCVAFVVNGVKQTISSLPMTLAADYTTVTQLGIMPLSDGNNLVINNGVMIYVQTSDQPSYASAFKNTLFPYETTGQITKNYENAPDKLNHFIRYAGETGSAVANRKAYLLTDLNIAQAAYIQQLEARITALETRLNNYNGKGMQIEAQYPGSSIAE